MAVREAAFFQIALVILFGAPEGLRRLDLGDDSLRPETALRRELLDLGARLRFLFRGMEKDGRAVLCPPVWPLAVQRRRVVKVEERIQELFVAHFRGLELQFDDLGMAGLVGANILVTWSLERAALVSDGRALHARNGPESCFNSPEAAGRECRFLCTHRVKDAGTGSFVASANRLRLGSTDEKKLAGRDRTLAAVGQDPQILVHSDGYQIEGPEITKNSLTPPKVLSQTVHVAAQCIVRASV